MATVPSALFWALVVTLLASAYQSGRAILRASGAEEPSTPPESDARFLMEAGDWLRCDITGHPCGTDTRPEGEPCPCTTCQQYRTL